MPIPAATVRYLEKRSVPGPWQVAGDLAGVFAGAVVIPSLAEGDNLFATLASLARNPSAFLERFPVVVVINHTEDAGDKERRQNHLDLERLAAGDFPPALRLAVVDAASSGLEMPTRNGGVGLARKIGCDLALPYLGREGSFDPVLVWLDADTLVDANYLPALHRHFSVASYGGAVVPFVHRPEGSAAEQKAIKIYELFLRHYVLGLELAGSPYAFHSVGSATACRVSAYVRAGGMNRRQAGEDFYFLQQLAKTDGVSGVRGTVVRPSSRSSRRVPFGTGASVDRWLTEGGDTIRFYDSECFRQLRRWLGVLEDSFGADPGDLLSRAKHISEDLEIFLLEEGLEKVWPKLAANAKRRSHWATAIHGWFDGLKTLRLVHRLSRCRYPMTTAREAVPPLLEWAGLAPEREVDGQLKVLRRRQMKSARQIPEKK